MIDGNPTFSAGDDSTIVEAKSDDAAGRRSMLIREAVNVYFQRRQAGESVTATQVAQDYRGFGSPIASSIIRQIEVEQFLVDYSLTSELVEGPAWPAVGDALGHFQIIEEIGVGGLARVYLADDRQLPDRQIVLKVGRSSLQEARTLSRLHHPHIVPVYSVFDEPDSGRSVICMPFLGRSTLNDLVSLTADRDGQLTASRLAEAGRLWNRPQDRIIDATHSPRLPQGTASDVLLYVAAALSSALATAHAQGVLHGDVKPSNVLLTPFGVPLLLDFNLSGDTGQNVVPRGGTLPYMPPEQLRTLLKSAGQPVRCEYDARSDLFSLAACLFELATGTTPVAAPQAQTNLGETAEALLDQYESGSIGLEGRLSGVDPGFAALLLRSLQVDPANRPQSADEFLVAVERLKSPSQRLVRGLRANRRKTIGIGAIALLAALGLGSYLVSRPPLSERLILAGDKSRAEGDLPVALRYYKQAVEQDENNVPARYKLGWTLADLQRFADARDRFYECVKSKRSLRANAALAYCFQCSGHDSAAVPFYEAAIADGDARPEVLNNLAVAYERGRTRMGRKAAAEEARPLLVKARQLAPQSEVIQCNLVFIDVVRHEFGVESALETALDTAEQLVDSVQLTPGAPSILAGEVVNAALRAGPELRERAIVLLAELLRRGVDKDRAVIESVARWNGVANDPRVAAQLAAPRSGPASEADSQRRFRRLLSVE